MNEKTNTQPTTTTKKLRVRKDTLRQLGGNVSPGDVMNTLNNTCTCTHTSSPCC